MQLRSPITACASTAWRVFFHGLGFAGQCRFFDAQLARFEQAQVGGDFVAGAEQHDVADHELFRRDLAALTVAQHRRVEREHVADGVQRTFRLAFLDHADDGVDEHHADDHAAIHPMGEQGRDRCRDQQHVDEDVVELAGETQQQAVFARGGQTVRAELFQAPARLVRGKPGCAGVERVQHLQRRHAVPVLWRQLPMMLVIALSFPYPLCQRNGTTNWSCRCWITVCCSLAGTFVQVLNEQVDQFGETARLLCETETGAMSSCAIGERSHRDVT